MTIANIAKDFTELLKQGDHQAAADKYNADDISSYEAMTQTSPAKRSSAFQ